MALFRKPKRIQRRVFCADDDDEGDQGEPEAPPPPIISQKKKENQPIKSTRVLSFADEEEDGEMFRVKKSSQSKKLSKRRDKERQKASDGDSNKNGNDANEEQIQEEKHSEDNEEKPKPKKKVTLEGLILSGREALAADGAGDLSDDSMKEEEEEDSRGFHTYRPETVRAALAVAPGLIPDAALIHAARKTRQQARELGGEYIAVRPEPAAGSRLVRDDGSADEDEEEGRLHVRGLDLPDDKPKRDTEAAPEEDEHDSDVNEWEEQQMQKAMTAIADVTGECRAELNPFAVAPPPPRLEAAPAHLRPLPAAAPLASAEDLLRALADRMSEVQAERSETEARRGEAAARAAAARAVRGRAAARRDQLAAAYRRAQAARGYLTDLVECLDEKMPQLEALEARALALHRRRCEFVAERRRADVRDQAQDVLALAARSGATRPADSEEKVRRTAEREGRRRARRLAREAAAAAAGAPPAHRDGDSSDDELPHAEQDHYNHEKESIRRLSASLFVDALPAWRSVQGVAARLARWRRREPALYADAYLPAHLPRLLAPYVRQQLILWNPLADEDNEDYEKMDWYKCLMMYGVRSEKVDGESEGSSSSEGESGGECGGGGGGAALSERSVREDVDSMLVPTIVAKVLLPKLTELVEHAWDPMSVRASVRLRALLLRAAALPGAAGGAPGPEGGGAGGAAGGGGAGAGGAGSPPLRRLAAAVRARLAAALHADVFLPALPPQVVEGPAGGLFWRRCLGAGVRLLRAALALAPPPPLLRADPLVLALIDTLCTGAGAAPAPLMARAAAALAETLPRAAPPAAPAHPRPRPGLRERALRRLAALALLALRRLQSDNPLHLKALEQVRNILAEAKAAENQ